MLESHIERYLRRAVEAAGGQVRKVQWPGRNSAPDRVVMAPARRLASGIDCAWCNPQGRTVWVELKAPGKKPTKPQAREHQRMRDAGQDVRVLDSLAAVNALMLEVFR